MKPIYTHENIAMVQNARNLLENSEIDTFIKNEFSSGGAGDLVPAETWPELCVLDEQDFDRASTLLRALADKTSEPDWTCMQCKEPNGAMFEYCWNCQSPC